jgi:hypothetical protein
LAIGVPLRSHWLPLAALEVSVTEPPEQNVVGPPAVTDGAAGDVANETVVPLEMLLAQPATVVPTVYVPAWVTVIVCAVALAMSAPLKYHWLPAGLLEVSCSGGSALHCVTEPAGVMTGSAGVGLTVTWTPSDVLLLQPLTVATTV